MRLRKAAVGESSVLFLFGFFVFGSCAPDWKSQRGLIGDVYSPFAWMRY